MSTTTTARVLAESEASADTTTLAEAVKTTFLLSMDAGLPLERRAVHNVLGGRMRDQLRALLGEYVQAGIDKLTEANSRIKTVNGQLDEAKEDLDRIADTIEGLAGSLPRSTSC